jgi:hypothetical protein
LLKFWQAKTSTTYKTHFFSALARALFTNASLIFANSLFVKTVGGKGYSQLFFFASMCAFFYYIFFALRGDKAAFRLYRAALILSLAASIGCFLEPMWQLLQPLNKPLLCLFAVSVMIVDLIGTTLGPIVLQASVNPALFREVYQKIVTSELVARVSAAGLIWALSQAHLLAWSYPIGWICLAAHFFLFGITLIRLRHAESNAKVAQTLNLPVMQTVSSSVRFIFGNPLVRVAMTIMVWTHVTKFLVEYLFYQVADSTFSSARQIASFVSVTTMGMLILSLIVQHLIGRKVTERLQLSTLFSVQPFNILLLGAAALLLPPFWPLVLLMVTYNIINRSIQLPVSRQCLVPIPRQQRSTIVSLICIVMSLSTALISGAMTAMKSAMHLQDFLVILLVLGASIFFVITGLDSYYIRNLWSFFREVRSGNWQDEPHSESLTPAELETGVSTDQPPLQPPTAELKSNAILDNYAHSFDKEVLAIATRDHKELLQKQATDLQLLGLRLCFIAGFPWFVEVFKKGSTSEVPQLRQFCLRAVVINTEFGALDGYTAKFRRRLKTLAMEVIDEQLQEQYFPKLKALIELRDRAIAEAIVSALTEPRFRELRDVLFESFREVDLRLSFAPIIDHMYSSDYISAQSTRDLLAQLSIARDSGELHSIIQSKLSTIKREELGLGSRTSLDGRDLKPMHSFMHTLFAEEYRLCKREPDKGLIDSISEFLVLSSDENAILTDMHLSFLKRSDLFKTWQTLMA